MITERKEEGKEELTFVKNILLLGILLPGALYALLFHFITNNPV